MNSHLVLLLFSVLSSCLASELLLEDCDIVFESKCITIQNSEIVTYREAEMKCEKDDGRLVVIDNPTLQDLIYEKIKKQHIPRRYWIGLSDRDVEGVWRYSNGQLLGKFQSWQDGEPNNYKGLDEDCVEIIRGKYWNDEICDKYNRYICEIDMTPGEDCDIGTISIPNSYLLDCNEPKVLQHGSSLPYMCNDNYEATVANAKVKCFNGTWKNFGHCRPVCRHPRLSENLRILSIWKYSYKLEDEVKLECNNGFFARENKLLPKTTMKCIGPNQWSSQNVYCIPPDNFLTSNEFYDHGKVIEIEFSEGESLTLKCQNETENEISYKWFKDNKRLGSTFADNTGFKHNVGQLQIFNSSSKNEGTYICIRRKEINQEFVDVTVYQLKQKLQNCNARNESESLIVNGKDSIVLKCPWFRPYVTSLLWMKDGKELGFNEEHHLYLPQGNLLIKNTLMEDNGRYSCVVTERISSCVHYHHYKLSIIPMEEEICGKKVEGISETHPWFISFSWEDEEKPFCYGVLVSNQWIVSTASCFTGIRPRMYPFIHIERVFDGSDAYENVFPFQSLDEIIIHPEFSKKPFLYDIALIKLSKVLTRDGNIVLPCLMNKDIEVQSELKKGRCSSKVKGQVPSQNPDEDEEHVPYTQEMILTPSDKCHFFGAERLLRDSMFCAQLAENNSVASFVESGSPFITEVNEQLYIKGIYNLNESVLDNAKSYYFTNISSVHDWIMSHIH